MSKKQKINLDKTDQHTAYFFKHFVNKVKKCNDSNELIELLISMNVFNQLCFEYIEDYMKDSMKMKGSDVFDSLTEIKNLTKILTDNLKGDKNVKSRRSSN
jgi:hypothetical protein